eukprot:12557298-Prorocentrum_lima.AAC.1
MLPWVAQAGGAGLRLVPGRVLEGGRWRRRAGKWHCGGEGASLEGDRIRYCGLVGGRLLWCDGVSDSIAG